MTVNSKFLPVLEPPSPDPLSTHRFPVLLCSERHPRPGHSACERCRFHPRMSLEAEKNPLCVWMWGLWFRPVPSQARAHLTVGLITEWPPLLPNSVGDVSFMLRFGWQLAIVAGPVWYTVAQAGLCRERRHPVAGECSKSCDRKWTG